MIDLIRGWLHSLRGRLTRHRVNDQRTPMQETEQRLERVERKLDAMIIRKAGPDFLDAAMTNREGRPWTPKR